MHAIFRASKLRNYLLKKQQPEGCYLTLAQVSAYIVQPYHPFIPYARVRRDFPNSFVRFLSVFPDFDTQSVGL